MSASSTPDILSDACTTFGYKSLRPWRAVLLLLLVYVATVSAGCRDGALDTCGSVLKGQHIKKAIIAEHQEMSQPFSHCHIATEETTGGYLQFLTLPSA